MNKPLHIDKQNEFKYSYLDKTGEICHSFSIYYYYLDEYRIQINIQNHLKDLDTANVEGNKFPFISTTKRFRLFEKLMKTEVENFYPTSILADQKTKIKGKDLHLFFNLIANPDDEKSEHLYSIHISFNAKTMEAQVSIHSFHDDGLKETKKKKKQLLTPLKVEFNETLVEGKRVTNPLNISNINHNIEKRIEF